MMRVKSWDQFIAGETGAAPLALTIGVFDGVHRGHRALLERVVRRGTALPAVITFLHNPKRLLSPGSYGGDVLSLRQKLEILEGLGIALTVLIDFSGNFSNMKGRDFIDCVVGRAVLDFLAVGANFRCGHRLDTGAADIRTRLEGRGIPVAILPPVTERGGPVSSSRVRDAIRSGDLALASTLLGRRLALDLSDLPSERGPGGLVLDPAARDRICPAPGRYGVRLYAKDFPRGREAEISVEGGKILIPSSFTVERVEFL
jgi:riboflavin kinase/FMN adenylyltransferase